MGFLWYLCCKKCWPTYWSFSYDSFLFSSILATWCEELTHWKRHRCWERLKAGREGGDRGWNGWHHLLNGHEFEQALGIGDAQGSLVCCSPWGFKESDTTERLNRTDESSKYSCHSYFFWISWSLPLLIPLQWQRKCEKMCSLLGLSSVIQAHISLGKLYKL